MQGYGKHSFSTESVRQWVEDKKRLFPSIPRSDNRGPLILFEEDFGHFQVAYDGYWTRFRSRSCDWDEQCRFEEAMQLPSLTECARYCWKLLMFRRRPQEVWESMGYLLPIISRGRIRSLKHDGDRLVDGEHQRYVIVVYTWGHHQRDTLKRELHAAGFTCIPWRRGCKAFEARFGPWRAWFGK